MKNKLVRILLISVIAFPSISNAQIKDKTLNKLIDRSIEVSPKTKMLQAKLNAAKNRIAQSSNLPDPILSLSLMNLPTNSFSFTQEPMTGKVFGLSQVIPFPGKLNAMGEVTAKDAEIVQKEIEDAINEIKKGVSQSYHELKFVRKAISISESTKKLLKDIAEVVRIKYSVSTASQQNLLKVELEITNVSDRIEELKSKELTQLAILNSYLLNTDSEKILTGEITDFEFINLKMIQLDSIAVNNRPYLQGIRLAENRAKLMELAAKFDYYPNFNAGVQYSQRDEIAKTQTPLNDFFSVMVGISLPLNYGGKVDAKVDEAVSMQNLYSQQYSLALQMLNANFGSSIAKLNSLQERIKLLLEGLLPQANQTLTTTLSSYQVGDIDFINVIDAQNKLYQIETNLYRLKTDYLKEVNELEFLIGAKLMNL